ncbi:VOC family protein [Microvirga alba]|uniref:VOC family protein n=1 Tax=Microvirga alba TaxID=2791025 RepID=A0A931FNK5_9HYPH|nr:VOC family protein [Microvirga alba]MBF9232417.1 VOC family protein [Microvirga alba]
MTQTSLPPFALTGLDHVVFRSAASERLVAFYRDVLGCALEREQPQLGLIQLRAGRSLIDIVSVDGPLGRAGGRAPGTEGRNVDHICLGVRPFDEAALRAHFAHHGISIDSAGPRYGAEGEGQSLYIRDPDGNTVEIKGSAT